MIAEYILEGKQEYLSEKRSGWENWLTEEGIELVGHGDEHNLGVVGI